VLTAAYKQLIVGQLRWFLGAYFFSGAWYTLGETVE